MKRLLLTILPILFLMFACSPQPEPEPKTEEPQTEEPQEPEEEKASLSVSPDSITLPGTKALLSITVTSNVAWTVSSTADWLGTTPSSGQGNAMVVVVAKDFRGKDETRTATLRFSYEDQSLDVPVSQVAEQEFQGSGTKEDPYLIASESDIRKLSSLTNDSSTASIYCAAHYKQTANISLSDKFTPIAQGSVSFTGSYDGGGHSIDGLKIQSTTVKKPTGFIAVASNAEIRSIRFTNSNIDAGYVYSGTVVGKADKTTVYDCDVSGQFRQYTSGLNVVNEANEGFSGGLAGWVTDCTIEKCDLDADVTIYGKYSGGLIGVAQNSTVDDCHLAKERTVNIYYHWNGGLVGVMRGASAAIRNCSFEGNLTSVGYIQGGIVGQVEGGRIEYCVLGSYGSIGSDKYFVGGIAGALVPVEEIVVDHCACYGTVKGQYAVGGIAGYSGFLISSLKISSATKPVTISNCATIGSEITATGNNGNANLYSIASGILAWSHGSNNLTLKGCFSRPALLQTISGGNRGALAGILAYQNSTSGDCKVSNCYSTLTPSSLLSCNDLVTTLAGYDFYGAIYCRAVQPTSVSNCYCDAALKTGTGDATESGLKGLQTAQFGDGTLLGKLQASAEGTTWIAGGDNLPTIEGLPADPNVKPKAAKRVSVIGDSISTFRGWIPGGYSAHYPAADGTLTLVNETYWYRLIHDYMKSAELDQNIAFSATTVTNTTDENYEARYGTATNNWFKHDFGTRFIEHGGCGQPDIILLHGGTNDWAHNADPLAPGVAIRNDANNIYGGEAPSKSIMDAIFAKADAASTRSEVIALPDGTFCEAYTKLLCLIRERYPKCKVVCIIGDYVSISIEQSILQIADHYGAKTVNLLRVNGFNDLGGYSLSTFKNQGSQPNMPKHDYSGNVNGCHPNSACMKFIAEKIYTELGTWLEE